MAGRFKPALTAELAPELPPHGHQSPIYTRAAQLISAQPGMPWAIHLRLELRQHGHRLFDEVPHHDQRLLPQVCIPAGSITAGVDIWQERADGQAAGQWRASQAISTRSKSKQRQECAPHPAPGSGTGTVPASARQPSKPQGSAHALARFEMVCGLTRARQPRSPSSMDTSSVMRCSSAWREQGQGEWCTVALACVDDRRSSSASRGHAAGYNTPAMQACRQVLPRNKAGRRMSTACQQVKPRHKAAGRISLACLHVGREGHPAAVHLAQRPRRVGQLLQWARAGEGQAKACFSL